MSFCTAINCMDGRVQESVTAFMKKRFSADYVDTITEPGPDLILATREKPELVESILNRLSISVDKHGSKGIAVVGHPECAGNPAPKDDQTLHLRQSVQFLNDKYPKTDVIALWADLNGDVEELTLW